MSRATYVVRYGRERGRGRYWALGWCWLLKQRDATRLSLSETEQVVDCAAECEEPCRIVRLVRREGGR